MPLKRGVTDKSRTRKVAHGTARRTDALPTRVETMKGRTVENANIFKNDRLEES